MASMPRPKRTGRRRVGAVNLRHRRRGPGQRPLHTVKLIAPAYVKPFVKRQKNDAAQAEAICEAAQRPTMRFVAVKSEAKQDSAATNLASIASKKPLPMWPPRSTTSEQRGWVIARHDGEGTGPNNRSPFRRQLH